MEEKYDIYKVEAEIYEANENLPDTMVFKLQWTANVGFGELTFYYNTRKKEWGCDDEYMGEEFCRAVLEKWLELMEIS